MYGRKAKQTETLFRPRDKQEYGRNYKSPAKRDLEDKVMAKKNENSAPVLEAEKEKTMVERIDSTELTPKQNVLNLETGSEEKVAFTHKKYALKDKALETAESTEETLTQIFELFGNDRAEIAKALVASATSRSYQEAKKAALSNGKYLTQEIRTRIVNAVRNLNPNYSELDASDAFKKWSDGYKAQKPGAVKILALVTQETDEFEL